MSRVSEKTKGILDEKMNDIESVISEEEEEEEEEEETSEHGAEETPDLYRNSALGL